MSEFKVLEAIDLYGEELSVEKISRKIGVFVSYAYQCVKRLESMGLIETRQENKKIKRRFLTKKGREVLKYYKKIKEILGG